MMRFIQDYRIPALVLALSIITHVAPAQIWSNRSATLPEERSKDGSATLRAFRPVAEAVHRSVVTLKDDGKTVALGTVIDADGFVLTKASEIENRKLTCELADGTEVEAEWVSNDEEGDVALVKVRAKGLRPIEWASRDVEVGQWVVTPGIKSTPEAIGIVSVPPRKILHKRAVIGVWQDTNAPIVKIASLTPGLGAEKAGLKPGDVILAVNGAAVKGWKDFANTLRQYREGQKVKLRVQRDEQEFDASVLMMLERMAQPSRRGRGSFNRQELMNRMGGELSQRAEGFNLAIQHDTVLQPWQCGGPLVDLEGKAVGLNIARAGRVASYALPAPLVKALAENLKKAQTTVKHEETRETSKPLEPALEK